MLNEDQATEVCAYITEVREFLRMQNWDVWLMLDEHCDEDAHASTRQSGNHDSLQIWLSEGFSDLTPWEKRNSIIHELLHAQHRDVSLLWDSVVNRNTDIPQSQAAGYDADFRQFMELVVSNWTRSIEQFAPTWPPACPDVVGDGIHIRR